MRNDRRVAVVGGGCAGISAAWHMLKQGVNVDLYEAEERLGGHAWTIAIPTSPGEGGETIDVDIGFMVFNHDNYPNLTAFFRELGLNEENSNMSLSVSLDGGHSVEWCSAGLSGLLAKRSQAFSPSFYRFVWDMLRFNKEAPSVLQFAPDDPRAVVTTGQYLRDNGYSSEFASNYLLPMMAALWSASIDDVLQFPAQQLVGFLCNHKMLQLFYRPQWKTVAKRSRSYTEKVASMLGDRLHLKTPILSISKLTNGSSSKPRYELFTSDSKSVGTFDDVVFACHPPTTLSILKTSDKDHDLGLLEALSRIQYADNVVYIHSDPALMPARRAAWASWNCLGKSKYLESVFQSVRKSRESIEGGESGFGGKAVNGDGVVTEDRMKAVYVTYWLNGLQNLKTSRNVFVSLNPHQKPKADCIDECVTMAHPQFTQTTLEARATIARDYQGRNGLWFCGAWEGYGFHEDACRSGLGVSTTITGTGVPWAKGDEVAVLAPPDLSKSGTRSGLFSLLRTLHRSITYDLPVAVCRRLVFSFLRKAITKGKLKLSLPDEEVVEFGDGSRCGVCDANPVTVKVFDEWVFVKVALEYDLGMARSYMSGLFQVEPLANPKLYDPVIRPPSSRNESNIVLGDPVGLTRLFLLFIGNRDSSPKVSNPMKSARMHLSSNPLTNASGLLISKLGSFLNFIWYKLTMGNSEKGGSLKNIHAHYDLSNDLFTSFLDRETLMYSSAIYDAVTAPLGGNGLVFRGSLEEAQWRKLDTLLARAQIQPGQTMLDVGFGWGGLSIHAAKKYGCRVHGVTLSVEQMTLAKDRVEKEGLSHLITFEVVDYRVFARRKENRSRFDRVLSCEMIEAVGHEYLGEFFWAVEQVLKYDGILVMEAITTPEERYETYRRSTDFINTVIFPGSCCPSLHSLVDAAQKHSRLTLEHIDNIGLHYAQTLAEWRRRFNRNEDLVRSMGFDDVFLRVWNYYFTYCEAGFHSQTENCLILVFSRQGCRALVPLSETRNVCQPDLLTSEEVERWVSGK